MGREVRKVPANWSHPKDDRGHYIPMFDHGYEASAKEWDEGAAKWEQGLRAVWTGDGDKWVPKDKDMTYSYAEWAGERPDQADYMPDWPNDERTHFQMYETTSEGTPISPVMETPEALAHWLSETGASSFADMTATYEQWLYVCNGGFACSAVIENDSMKSGVEALSET